MECTCDDAEVPGPGTCPWCVLRQQRLVEFAAAHPSIDFMPIGDPNPVGAPPLITRPLPAGAATLSAYGWFG